MLITNRFDNHCQACGDIAWAGEKVFYNPQADKGQKIRHENCGEFPKTEPQPVPVVETKECRKCKKAKPLAEFSKHPHAKDRKQAYCRPCNKEYNREWAQKRITAKATQKPVEVRRGRPPLHHGCKVDGCDRGHWAKGFCASHYAHDYNQRKRSQPVQAAPVVLEGDKAIADKLGITVEALHNMPFGQVGEYLAMAERLENLRRNNA